MTICVGIAAALVFATTVTGFEARVTDLAARRILEGQVPYRDFWTMYAPGSYTVLAAAFALFGRELIVSNILGLVVSAASVAAYHRAAMRVAPPAVAAVTAILVAVAFWSANYHSGFTSYPPASVMLWLTVIFLARFSRTRSLLDLTAIGCCLSIALLFKHDAAGYACLATALALFMMHALSLHSRLRSAAVVAGIVLSAAGIAISVIVRAGAGQDLWQDLVRFPLTDFRYVRPEYFPLVPHVRSSWFDTIRELLYWAKCNLPLYAAALGLFFLWRERGTLGPERLAVATFAAGAYPLFWLAAHVQLNTHVITLTALGALVGVAGLFAGPLAQRRARFVTPFTVAIAIGWGGIHLAEPGAKFALSLAQGREWLALPHLWGIAVPPADAKWMRGLAAALRDAEQPDAPLLMVANRNDVVVFAEGVPYWLSDRKMATRHHELHPGVTDTEPVQRRMVADLQMGPLPVVVREHRFNNVVLARVKTDFLKHVPVGSQYLDQWLERHFAPAQSFGSYQLLVPRQALPVVETK